MTAPPELDRDPGLGRNAAHHLLSLRMMMAACESAENEGLPTPPPQVAEPSLVRKERS